MNPTSLTNYLCHKCYSYNKEEFIKNVANLKERMKLKQSILDLNDTEIYHIHDDIRNEIKAKRKVLDDKRNNKSKEHNTVLLHAVGIVTTLLFIGCIIGYYTGSLPMYVDGKYLTFIEHIPILLVLEMGTLVPFAILITSSKNLSPSF
jgi:hypothetical protein